ncbi:MAG: peptidylprolyl isomerase [Gaiellaceae bacterium]
MKTRLLFAPLLIAAVAALAACGGGAKTVPSNAVALVGSVPVTKVQFNELIKQAESQAKAAGQPVPTIGSAQYTQLSQKVVAYLVQVSELEQQAPKEGVKVTSKDVDAYLQSIAKLHYGGSQKKLDAEIVKSGLTIPEARQQVMVNLIAQRVKNKVTGAAKVSTSDEEAYYKANQSAYHQPETRNVRHILVGSKSLANKLETKLANGASFASLAKKYSKDTGTAKLGGKYTARQGQDVPQFDKAAFSLKAGATSAPVHSQFGWHIIQALGPVMPARTAPFKQVQSQIEQQLVSQKQQTAWSAWLANLQKQYQDKVEYQTGYAPPPTSTTATTTPAPPTTTG